MGKKKSLEELDAEMARLEAELRALEDGKTLPGEGPDEAVAPDAGTSSAQGATAPGRGRLRGRFKRRASEAEETEPPESSPEPEAGPFDAPPSVDETAPQGTPGRMRGLKARFGRSQDEPDAPQEPAEQAVQWPDTAAAIPDRPEVERPPTGSKSLPGARPELWDRTDLGWRRREAQDPATQEQPAGDEARSLLGRFRRHEETGPVEGPATEGEEGGRRRAPLLWIILLLALAVIIVAVLAYVLLAGDENGGIAGGGDAPVADLALDGLILEGQVVALTNEGLEFDASGTTGTVDEYRWSFGDGQTQTTTRPTVTHRYTQRGPYTASVTAVGPDGEGAAEIKVLVVMAPAAVLKLSVGDAEVAAPGTVGNNIFTGVPVALDGSASTADPDHELRSFEWDINDDGRPDATGATTETTFPEAGMFMVQLKVTDDLGNVGSATRMVHVSVRTEIADSLEPSLPPDGTQDEHPVDVAQARGRAGPVQVRALLSYPAPALGPSTDNLNLVLVDAGGNEFAATDDEGAGTEEIVLTEADLASLGAWTVRVVHEVPGLGTIQYSVVVEVYY